MTMNDFNGRHVYLIRDAADEITGVRINGVDYPVGPGDVFWVPEKVLRSLDRGDFPVGYQIGVCEDDGSFKEYVEGFVVRYVSLTGALEAQVEVELNASLSAWQGAEDAYRTFVASALRRVHSPWARLNGVSVTFEVRDDNIFNLGIGITRSDHTFGELIDHTRAALEHLGLVW